jgi:hypothetical protein
MLWLMLIVMIFPNEVYFILNVLFHLIRLAYYSIGGTNDSSGGITKV